MPERWQEVEKVFEAARERAPAERGAFLDQACAGDEELRKEVESLLTHHQQAQSFIESPAVGLHTSDVDGSPENWLTGQQVGHYKVLQQIGRGGMGEVYLAQDSRLQRRVALKVLPAEFVSNRDRLHRFEQEARAASALNHPNILTIHEVGKAEGLHFIATEYIEGVALRQRMTEERIELPEVLDITTQVASALAAAHQAGIVHRDIKPENIMLRRDGFIKVLDFGLAKLLDESEAQTASIHQTEPTEVGVPYGSATYAAPEQARGERVDARADIFSTGVLLYEMLTGTLPFRGKTVIDVLHAVLHQEPLRLAEVRPIPTPRLQQILDRALAKDPRDRYQTIVEFRDDLKSIQRYVAVDAITPAEEVLLHANLWVEEGKTPILPPPRLKSGATYFLLFAIEPEVREMVSSSQLFFEPRELRESAATEVRIVVASDLLKNIEGRETRQVKYHAGKGFAPESFTLATESEGPHFVTVRLFYEHTIIYRERMCIEVVGEMKSDRLDIVGSLLNQ